MKKFKLSQQLIDRAQERADKLPLLNNSIRKGEGALVAYIGEEVAKHVLGGEKNTPPYQRTNKTNKRII